MLYTTANGFRLDFQSEIWNSNVKASANTKYRIDMASYLNINNTRVATIENPDKKTFTAGAPLTIFALNSAGSVDACSKAICHSFYAWKTMGDDSTRMLDLVACEKNGEVGFYNKVNGKFYGNSGTGAFEAVEPEIVNTNAQVIAVSSALPQPPPPGVSIIFR